MKILESQSAVLTSYEVHQHLIDQRERYKKNKRRGPPNLETVVRESLKYLHTHPSPLSQDPVTYTPECIARLLERLRPYDLSKGEVAMVLNLRPSSVPALNTVVEDMAERFTEEQQEEMLAVIAEVLGQFPDAAEQQDGDKDVAMDDAAGS